MSTGRAKGKAGRGGMRNYKNIKAYQSADLLVLKVYEITREFPREELYGLISQLRRAAVSVACNIAEGASRQHKKDYLNFLYMARGSAAEAGCLVELSGKLGYVKGTGFQEIAALQSETAKTLTGLIGAVEAELDAVTTAGVRP